MQSNWYLINIKARTEQKPEHYVTAFKELLEQDPLVNTWRDRYVSMSSINESNENCNDIPSWMILKFISYIIIDKNAFYSIKSKRHVNIEWDSDIVANFKESECIFIPSRHTLAVRTSTEIPVKQLISYLSSALNQVEPDTYDITEHVSKGFINTIRKANAIIRIDADISFSNPTNTRKFESFHEMFDEKLRKANPDSVHITIGGTKSLPLNVDEDGLVDTILTIAETDGRVVATIQEEPDGVYEKVDSKYHPKILPYNILKGDFWGGLYNTIMTFLHNE